MSVKGRFVWHDLMTNDAEAAKAYYEALFGWEIRTDHGFTLIYSGGEHIGAVMPLPSTEVPSNWLPYIATDDVDATVAQSTAAGAQVMMAPMDIPGGGRFSVIGDPTGATFAAFQYTGNRVPKETFPSPPPVGAFCWDEVHTTDRQRAAGFYPPLFDWTSRAMDMGPGGTYVVFQRDGRDVGGCMESPAPHSFWLSYVAVADADATIARALQLDSKVMMGPHNVPGVGRIAILMDPRQAAIGIVGPAT